jgi:hypothetical protein
MKKLASLMFCVIAFQIVSFAQTNTFPSTGTVGIGTTSPNSAVSLHLYGSNPRLAFFDQDVAISSNNPAWITRSAETEIS